MCARPHVRGEGVVGPQKKDLFIMSQVSLVSTGMADLAGAVVVRKEIGGRVFTLETGVVGKLAGATVIATCAGTTVLASVVRPNPREGIDFFPLTVDYREKTPAAGKFLGGFKKREGSSSEKEILTMRMIDCPIRPLFLDGFVDEVMI